MLDVIIGRHTWSGQIRTHIHTKIHKHQKTKKIKKVDEKESKKKGGG